MPDFGRWRGNGGDPSLNAIAHTDSYLDALAFEQPVYASDPADAELANLMAGWRDEVRRPPARVATMGDAEIALQRALASRRRGRASMAVVGSVAAAMLCLGGFGALVYGAGPGDALYGLRVAVFGEQQVTRDDQVALAAQTEMQQVQKLIEQGDWDAAQDRLTTITSTVQTVEDPQRQRNLQQQLNDLTAKVETRDVNATAPPLPDASIVPNVSIPNPQGPISLPPLPQLPPSVPGIPLPDISLPQVPLPSIPQLPIPGPGVPPDISLPDLPSLPLPKPPVDLPKPPVDVPKPQVPDPPTIELPKPIEPQKPVEPQKPIEPPKPIEQPKPADQPKPLIPEILPQPKPAPEPEAPVQDAPAPKAPPALAPAPEPKNDTPSTTIWPMPGEKPGRGNGNGNGNGN